MSRFLRDAVITTFLLGAAAAAFLYAAVHDGGLAATEEPGRLERAIAGSLVRLSIPAGADRQQNPFSGDSNTWRQAREHYQDHCAVCHGRDGRGSTEVGKNMYPKVPDLASADVQGRSDGALFYIIQNGVRWTGMPAWKEAHSAEETWKLVAWVRKIPTLTEAELESEEGTGRSGEPASAHPPGTRPHRHRY